MSEAFAPRRTGKDPQELDLTDMFVPFYDNGQPCLLNLPMSPHEYLPCFDTTEQLRRVLERGEVAYDRIKKIDNGREFMVSVPPEVIIVVNMRWTERGTIKFLQVFRD